ncbi:MAG: phosphoribosylglycinamide formyltransferase [Bacteroidota bacterium]|jgi:phosphoribosylglycinamide formyltransferase-1
MTRIALFASGSGSNVENIASYFANNDQVVFTKVYCNKPDAFVLQRAAKLGLATRVFTKAEFSGSETIVQELLDDQTDLIILAGFLWMIPVALVKAFPAKIVNIHPALLPKFGGKGMYGMHVHEAVVANKEIETGITIHYVNEHYDEGPAIFQAKVAVLPADDADAVAQKIHQLEFEHFPKVIEMILKK